MKTDADPERALHAAERHLDDHANDAATTPLLIGIARGWLAIDEFERAAALLERAAARSDSGRGTALVGFAEVQERLGRPDLAMGALRTATTVEPRPLSGARARGHDRAFVRGFGAEALCSVKTYRTVGRQGHCDR